MGFASVNCKGCGHPLLAQQATSQVNAWMTRAVAILEGGEVVRGDFDGYMRLETSPVDQVPITGATAWHDACWQVAGRPAEYTGESGPAADQGWFFSDPDHDMPEPAIPAGGD